MTQIKLQELVCSLISWSTKVGDRSHNGKLNILGIWTIGLTKDWRWTVSALCWLIILSLRPFYNINEKHLLIRFCTVFLVTLHSFGRHSIISIYIVSSFVPPLCSPLVPWCHSIVECDDCVHRCFADQKTVLWVTLKGGYKWCICGSSWLWHIYLSWPSQKCAEGQLATDPTNLSLNNIQNSPHSCFVPSYIKRHLHSFHDSHHNWWSMWVSGQLRNSWGMGW